MVRRLEHWMFLYSALLEQILMTLDTHQTDADDERRSEQLLEQILVALHKQPAEPNEDEKTTELLEQILAALNRPKSTSRKSRTSTSSR